MAGSGTRAGALVGCLTFALAAAGAAWGQTPEATAAMRARLPQDEVIYFLLPDRFANGDLANDRGGFTGDRLVTGFDPAHPDFYHGGDLVGLTRRLDYIQGLGVTAIWIAPVFRNKPVQGESGRESAGYHGYWILDFTSVDPHFGTDADLKTFVDAAHARGIKVYLDIVTNHTADVIQYEGCTGCDYRGTADHPWTRAGGVDGPEINAGFDPERPETFAALTRFDWAYRPFVPEGERDAKRPAWLNDLGVYHNRGDSTFRGESSLLGDFAGLDGVMTEHPRVVQGFIDVYGEWIDRLGIDGFRIDTAKHVNPEFWQAFVPAMRSRAAARGIPNFHIFGEVYDHDPAALARHTRVDGLPSVLDFAFQTKATDVAAGRAGPDVLARVHAADPVYEGGEQAALTLPTFLGNHDMGRIGWFLAKDRPDISDEELLARTTLAHALMMFSRGVPVIYYGDEQGFMGEGDYGRSRHDMWTSAVPDYRDGRRVGGPHSPYDASAPLYVRLSEMARIRRETPLLRRGLQVTREADDGPGLYAFSRLADDLPGEVLVVFNTGTVPIEARVAIEPTSLTWRALHGACAVLASAPGSFTVRVEPLDYIVCVSEDPR
ncbi:MAG: alpha-amylase [Caulobacteraceae bacterium]|nr:alpha-amylase [Caulobacteraceae bacterium]